MLITMAYNAVFIPRLEVFKEYWDTVCLPVCTVCDERPRTGISHHLRRGLIIAAIVIQTASQSVQMFIGVW